MGSIDEILAGYEAMRSGQEAFYQDLHRHPELSHREHDTARRVAESELPQTSPLNRKVCDHEFLVRQDVPGPAAGPEPAPTPV
jgi:hypothetical protein